MKSEVDEMKDRNKKGYVLVNLEYNGSVTLQVGKKSYESTV